MAKKVSVEKEAVVEEVSVSETKAVEPAKPKKSKKTALTIIICSIVVVALAVGGFFAYKMFMGKNPVKVTSNAIRGLKDSIVDVKEDNSEVSKIIDGGAFEIDSSIKVDLSQINGEKYTANLLVQADTEDETVKFDIKAKDKYSTIIDLSALIEGAKAYFKFNDTMSNYYYAKLEDVTSEMDIEKLPAIPDYKWEKLIDYLADSFEGAFSNKDFEKEKEELTIGGKDVKVNKYTANVDEVKLKAIVDKFLDKVASDKDLMEVIATLTETDESEIKDAINQEKNTKVSECGEVSFDYSVYVTTSGKTIGFGFNIEGVDFIIAEYNDVISIQAVAEGMPITLEFEQKSDNHVVATLNAMGMITGKLDIKSEEETITKGKEYKETLDIEFTLDAMGEKISASVNAESTIKKISSVDTSAKKGAISIDDMSETEASIFMSQVERSATYKFLDSIFGSKAKTPNAINYSYSLDEE